MNFPSFPSLWNVFANPFFRRHAVARLRPWTLLAWVFVSQVVTGFAWISAVCLYLRLQDRARFQFDFASPEFQGLMKQHGGNAFLIGWLVVLVIQTVILLFKGTFSVATGVAREANEGMIEAQLLTPTPTGHKVLGQLLGLPILEIVVAAQLTLWAGLSAALGGLSPAMMAKVYLILGTSALLHHGMGLLAGTLIRQKVIAGTISQVAVFLIHFLMPSLGKAGIGLISHLGIVSGISHEIASACPDAFEPHGFISPDLIPRPVELFVWQVSVSGYGWGVMVSLLAFLLTILARRWNDPGSQLLGKIGTPLLAAWVLTLTCGEFLPGFWRGEGILGSQGVTARIIIEDKKGDLQSLLFANAWIASFATLLGIFSLTLAGSLVPSAESRLRFSLSARRTWWSDGRNALPWVLLISLMAAAAWSWVTSVLLRDAPMQGGEAFGWMKILRVTAALVVPSFAFHSLVACRGWGSALMTAFVAWLMPLMASAIGLLLGANPLGWPLWLANFSGLALPAFGTVDERWGQSMSNAQLALYTSLIIHVLATLWCLWTARASRKGEELLPS
jgi:hypothetical protein